MKKPTLYGVFENTGRRKYAEASMISRTAETALLDDFFARLAENLMLNELLCGEANPVEFLKNQIVYTHKTMCAESAERRANRYREEAAKRQVGE